MLQNQNRDRYEKFFETTGGLDGRQMVEASISYIAFQIEGVWQLARARLYLESLLEEMLPPYSSASVRIGRYKFSDLGKTVKQFLDDSIESSTLNFPEGTCTFKGESGGHSTHVTDLHHDGLKAGNRLRMLSISGANAHSFIDETSINWELKSQPQPYDSLQELTNSYGTGMPNGGQTIIEVVAYQTTAIERPASSITEGQATLSQILLKGYSTDKASMGYVVYKGNKVLKRDSIRGQEMTWTDDADFQRGKAVLPVEPGAVVKCFARYSGVTHHEMWVDDPTLAQNNRRTAYSTFDEGLGELKSLLDSPYVKGRDARLVETALSWVLWMLGFSPIQIGGIKKTQEAPDLIVATPNGDLALIECTTGLLSADKKIPQLAARTVLVRKKLNAAGNQGTRLISVLITTRSSAEIQSELEQATQANILVATKEDIERALSQSLISMDANALYDLALKNMDERRQKNKSPFGGA